MSEDEQHDGFRWGKWLLRIAIFLVVAVLISHAIWSSMASSRLQRLVQAAKDAGEPVLPEHFRYTGIDAPDNAATDVLAAANMIDPDGPSWEDFNDLRQTPRIPLWDNERKIIAEMVRDFPPILDRMAKAEGKTRFALDLDLTSPMMEKHLPDLSKARALATVLYLQAMHDFENGRHDAAMNRIMQIEQVSRTMDHHISIVGHLVAIGCEALRASGVEVVTPDLKIGTEPGAATPEQVRRMIDSLLFDGHLEAGLLRSLRGDRMMQLDTMNCLITGVPIGAGPGAAGTAWNPMLRYFARPVIDRNAITMFTRMTEMVEAVGVKNFPAYNAKVKPVVRTGTLLDFLSNMYLPSLDRFWQTHFQVLTDRRLTAIALAIRWYAIEHDGQLPARLEQLVPKYLHTIPLDPMAAGAPLKYLPHPTTPMLYSTGPDGVDDGGSEAPINPRRSEPGEWERKDRIMPLYRRPRPVPLPDDDMFSPPPPTSSEAATAPSET